MWSADRDGDVEGDDEMTDILDSVKERCIDILQGIQGRSMVTRRRCSP